MTHDTPLFSRICLIGLGLIGSSLARGIRKYGLAHTLVASDTSPHVRMRAKELGLADQIYDKAEDAVKDADLIILCAPVGANDIIGQEIAPHLKPGAIVSDVGSVKKAVVETLHPLLPNHVYLIPAHPVAGTEYSGPDAGFATLFENRWTIITPLENTPQELTARLQHFWEGLNAYVEVMTPHHHDLVLAMTSHIPHLIAYNIVGTAADLENVTQSEVIKFSAGGFRDFTRIAASDPTMWRDIFLNNREAVLEVLGRFSEDLAALQRMIRWGDGEGLFELFTRTRSIRKSIIEEGQETAEADFGRVHIPHKG